MTMSPDKSERPRIKTDAAAAGKHPAPPQRIAGTVVRRPNSTSVVPRESGTL